MNRMLSQALLSFVLRQSVKGFLCLHFLIESVQTRSSLQTGSARQWFAAEALQTELFSELENVKSHLDGRLLTKNRRRVKRFHSGGYIQYFPVSSPIWFIPDFDTFFRSINGLVSDQFTIPPPSIRKIDYIVYLRLVSEILSVFSVVQWFARGLMALVWNGSPLFYGLVGCSMSLLNCCHLPANELDFKLREIQLEANTP